MKLDTTKAMSVWAALTGLALAGWFFVTLWLGMKTPSWLPTLIAIIGGFELFMFGQDFWLRRRSGDGRG